MVNVGFDDAYTGEKYVAGKVIELSEQRVAEVKEIDKNLISVIGNVVESEGATGDEMTRVMNDLEAAEEKLRIANAEATAIQEELDAEKAKGKAAEAEIDKLKKKLEKAEKAAKEKQQ